MSSNYTVLKERTVLYVEDEELGRVHMREMLRRRFSKVHLAKNGKEALEVIDEYRPDVVITDYRMPVLNGSEMLQELRKKGDSTPVIFLTAYPDEVEDVFDVKILEKPFKRENLLDALVEAMKLQ